MKLIEFSQQHLAERLSSRPAEYAKEIEQAIVRRDEKTFIDIDHAAYKEAVAKYRPARQAQSARPASPSRKGPGDYLHEIIAERTGSRPTASCGCQSMRKKMNAWGVAGCREHMDEIVQHMLGQRKRLLPWQRWLLALPGGTAVARVKAREMIEESLRRTEQQAVVQKQST